MDKVTGHSLRILIYLNKKGELGFDNDGNLKVNLKLENKDYQTAKTLLSANGFTISSMSDLTLVAKGANFISNHLRDEILLFRKNRKAHSYEFALLEFIKNREIVEQYELPEELIDFLPTHQKGAGQLGSVIQVVYENREYYENRNDGFYKLNYIGHDYYEEVKENEERERNLIFTPTSFIDNSTHVSGTGHQVIGAFAKPESSFNKTPDVTDTPLAKKNFNLNKWMLLFAILAVVVSIAIYLLQ